MKIQIYILLLFSFSAFASETNKLDSLTTELNQSKGDKDKVTILNELGLHILPSNPEGSKKMGLRSLGLAKKIKYPKGIAAAYNLLALNEEHRGNYVKTIDYYFKALRIIEKNDDEENIATLYFNIGNVYKLQRDYTQALNYLTKGLKLYKKVNNYRGITYSYNSLGLLYADQDDVDKAIEYFQKCLDRAKKSGYERMIAGSSLNLAGVLDIEKNFELIIQSFNDALNSFINLDDKKGVAIALNNLGVAYLDKSMPEKSIGYFLESIEKAKIISFKPLLENNYLLIHNAYSNSGDYQKAYEYALLNSDLKSDLLNESKVQIIAEIETKYQVEKKEQELLLGKKEIEILEKDKEIRSYFFYGILVFVLLTLLSFLGWFRAYRGRKRIEENEVRNELNFYIKELDILKKTIEVKTESNGLDIISFENAQLSERELEVLVELSKGKTNKEISESLFISVNTVKSHLKLIYEKLNVKNRTQAAKKMKKAAD